MSQSNPSAAQIQRWNSKLAGLPGDSNGGYLSHGMVLTFCADMEARYEGPET